MKQWDGSQIEIYKMKLKTKVVQYDNEQDTDL